MIAIRAFPDRIPALREMSRQFDAEVICLTERLLCDSRFPLWSGSSRPEQHHYGAAGLQQHTWEVATLSLQANDFFAGNSLQAADPRILFLGAVFHDSGKMFDYEPADEGMSQWRAAEHKRVIHHISRSALIWHDATKDCGVSGDLHDRVLHVILSHHGSRQAGSPVFPKSREAWIVHLCDGISARVTDCDRLDLVHGKPS